MKKITLLTGFLILTIGFSCQEHGNTLEPQVNFEEVSVFLSGMMHESIIYSSNNFEINVDGMENNVSILNAEITSEFIKKSYFPGLSKSVVYDLNNQNVRIKSEHKFTEAQLEFMVRITESMNDIENAEDFYSIIDQYRNVIILDAEMSIEEKIQMFGIVEYSYVLHEAILEGIFTPLLWKLEESENGRVTNEECPNGEGTCPMLISYCEQGPNLCSDIGAAGCFVDWRSVWGSAVIGLAYGSASGFYTGATAGTVVFPGIGTVTGAVSAGVVGGAIGFVEGAVLGVAGNLLLTCGR